MTIKVGIPGSLLYYLYYPMWRTFFNELGVQVVTSGKTTKNILDQGTREALADACVPIKLFYGHVMDIKEQVDYLYIPRVVCLNGKTVYCPKFLGLPDMIRYSIENVPPIIDVRMDTRQGRFALVKAYLAIGKILGAPKSLVLRAYVKAVGILYRYNRLLRKGWSPVAAMNFLDNQVGGTDFDGPLKPSLKFAVLGYPYAIYDSFISVNLIDKLMKYGVKVITAENIHPTLLALQKNCNLPKRLFWTLSDRALKAAHYLFNQNKIDGVLHLTAFGCGPDSLLNRLIEMEAKKHSNIPFMTLMIDEQTGDAGMTTRLEAFVDMVRRRKEVH
ncbi:MAG: acyl-CoA dehydratase activase-related protein [Desulfotomaculaceae bacterium]|nr:acyl-CoA dehydratase activase-related protein [Desulfotomaculaceae bacterium]